MLSPTKHPGRKQLREFGLLTVLILGWQGVSFEVAAHESLDSPIGLSLLLMAVAVLIVTIYQPGLLRVPFVILITITYPLGLVLSKILLIVLYFSVIGSISIWQKILRMDPLKWRRAPELESYLAKVDYSLDPKNYHDMY